MIMEEEHGRSIPDFLNAEAFISARMKELTSLTSLIGESKKVTTIFQRLPKHMRRRAMSHSVKRVPRNLRASHKRQLMKNNALKKSKKARKRYRKRPKELSSEYNRRQRTKAWLETHIWHAKRFRMSTTWNYKIAESSYEKTFKAVYRATMSHCLLQDISYYCCVELHGYVDALAGTFKLITDPACGLSIRAKCWLSGGREGSITVFHANSYPYNVIGTVNFMWKPTTNESEMRTLWLWCHPSIHQEIVDELVQVFALHEVEGSSSFTNDANDITLVLLKDKLNRFRLTGPLANAVLTKALHAAEMYDEVLLESQDDSWWSRCERAAAERGSALSLLETHPQPFLFPAHSILGCNIVDPRLFLKRAKAKALPDHEGGDYCPSIPSNFVLSAIWETEVRDEVSARKCTTAKLNALRKDLLVPGFDKQLLKIVNNVIPVLLVQRPGSSARGMKRNYSCGWDIILPSNWAMPVWLSLILCGARAGGLRETRTIHFESQQAPAMCPDSRAGKEHYAELRTRCEDSYFKKPPKKRANYLKLSIQTPFHHDWKLLVEEWCPVVSGSYFVLRDRSVLLRTQDWADKSVSQRTSYIDLSLPPNALIPITVTMLGKGNLPAFSHICLPTESDLMCRMRDKCSTGPSEKSRADIFRHKRKRLRLEHAKELKRLRRKRMKEKRARMQTGPPLTIKKRKKSPTEAEVRAYLRRMRDLWIPAEITKLRKYCSREVCGFVVVGGFSYLKSCVVGQGYIVAEALTTLFQQVTKSKSELIVLIRCPNSLHYRFCKINIVVP